MARVCVGAPLLCASFLSLTPAAQAESEQSFTLQGFGTFGAARTTSNDVEFVRDLSQPRGARQRWDGRPDSILGVQANWRISPQLETVVQAISRYRYDQSFTPELSWAYVKYDPTPQWSLRAGRLGTEFFMMADSRLVGYSFLSVRPPGDFFLALPFYSINGADVVLTVPVGDNLLRGKLFYGQADSKLPLADQQWRLAGSAMAGAYVDYQAGAWQFRLSYANIRFKQDLPIDNFMLRNLSQADAATAMAHLATANTRSDYFSAGAVYDHGPWQIQLMFNHIEQGSQTFESSDAAYILAGYRISAVTPYLGYSWVSSDPRGNRVNSVVDQIMADAHVEQATTIVGARWDVLRNVALKAQWDGVRGAASSIFPYRREQRGWDGKMDVFSVTVDFLY